MLSCVSAFFYNIYGKICGIPENFPRYLKSVVHIPEEQHLGLASLYQVYLNDDPRLTLTYLMSRSNLLPNSFK